MPDSAVVRSHRLFKRALLAWLVLIGVEVVHGILRTIVMVPVVGDFRSRQIGVFTGSLLILAVAYVLVPWLHATGKWALVLVSTGRVSRIALFLRKPPPLSF